MDRALERLVSLWSSSKVALIVIALLVAALTLSTCGSRRAIDERDARVDSLRTEQLRLQLEARGFETRLASATDDLERRLQESVDSTDALSRINAELAREVELLGGSVRSLAEMYVGAVGTIEASAAEAFRSAPDAPPDSIVGDVTDGLLRARVRATVTPPTVGIPAWSIDSLALVASVSETADGRALFAARAVDPRVTIQLGDVYYQPPPPVAFCSFGTRAKDHGRGYAILRGLEWALGELIP